MKGFDMASHINIVRFRLKPELKERVIQAHRDFNIVSWDSAKSLKLVDCGDWVCDAIEWQSKQYMERAMPKLVLFLQQWHQHLQEISSELEVTDAMVGA